MCVCIWNSIPKTHRTIKHSAWFFFRYRKIFMCLWIYVCLDARQQMFSFEKCQRHVFQFCMLCAAFSVPRSPPRRLHTSQRVHTTESNRMLHDEKEYSILYGKCLILGCFIRSLSLPLSRSFARGRSLAPPHCELPGRIVQPNVDSVILSMHNT